MLSGSVLCNRLPHAGTMCLLERIVAWDEETIHCTATSHWSLHNPLRNSEGLAAVSGIEYAAQTMALHGTLLAAGSGPRTGFLARLKELQLGMSWLHDLDEELHIFAAKVCADDAGAIYDFRLEASGLLVLSGRATVIYQCAEETP